MEKRKIGMAVTSVLLGGILAFSVYAATLGDGDVVVTRATASASASGAHAGISTDDDAPLEAVARMANGMGWTGDSLSAHTSSLDAYADPANLNYPSLPVQSSRASSALDGVTKAEDYWSSLK